MLRDWQINGELPGADHPMLNEILKQMSKVRGMSEREKNKLKKRIREFEAIDRNHTSMAGTLDRRFERVRDQPYRFPRALTDNELRQFLELHKTAREISERVRDFAADVAKPSRGPQESTAVPSISNRLAAVQKLSGKFNLPTALTVFFSNVSVNHYDQFVRMYERELERRNSKNTN